MHGWIDGWMDGWMDTSVCMRPCMHVYVCIYLCMTACMQICMYVCTYSNIHYVCYRTMHVYSETALQTKKEQYIHKQLHAQPHPENNIRTHHNPPPNPAGLIKANRSRPELKASSRMLGASKEVYSLWGMQGKFPGNQSCLLFACVYSKKYDPLHDMPKKYSANAHTRCKHTKLAMVVFTTYQKNKIRLQTGVHCNDNRQFCSHPRLQKVQKSE